MENQDFDVEEYIKQMSLLLNLQIHAQYQDGVVANFAIIKDIAEVVNNFPLSEEIQIAPVFEP